MKNLVIRKRILALLVGCNIMLTGCSISGGLTSKNNKETPELESWESSFYDSSVADYKSKNNSDLESSKNLVSDDRVMSSDGIEESLVYDKSSLEEESIDEPDEIVESEVEQISNEPENDEMSEYEESYIEDSSEIEESKLEDDNQISDEDSVIEVYTDDEMYIRATSAVNVRTEPNIDSNIVSVLYEGNFLKKLGFVGNWYIADFNGQKVYVSADYVELIDKSEVIVDLNESNVCYFPYGATLYSDSSLSNQLYDIPSLESGQILRQEGNTYYVDTSGYKGYVLVSSAVIIPQPVVIVDKSEQTLRLFKNNNIVMEFPVVTGNENPNFYHPSDEGLFSIYSKKYNAELVGPLVNGIPEWDVVVNIFMGYNGGEGIHDAVWRSYFGGDVYTYDGSHGCINCPYDYVMDLAEYLEVGNKVLVKR